MPVHHGVFYPFLLGVLFKLFGSLPGAAVFLNAVLFASTIVLLVVGLRSVGRWSEGASLMAGLLVLLSLPMLNAHAWLMSEPLFLFLQLLALLSIVLWVDGRCGQKGLWLCGVASGLCLLTRYAGGSVVLASIVSILLVTRLSLRRRLKNAVTYAIIACGPTLVLLVANALRVGTATNRVMAWHPISASTLRMGLYNVLCWFMPWSWAEALGTTGGALALLVLAAVLIVGVVKADGGRSSTARMLLVFAATYVVYLLAAVSVFDVSVMLDQRMLSPLALVAIPLAVNAVMTLDRTPTFWIGRAVLAFLLLLYATRALGFVREGYGRGFGYASKEWRNSELMTRVRAMPSSVELYSNAPDAIFLLTSRGTRPIPWKRSPTSGVARDGYEQELMALAEDVREGRAVVMFFDNRYWSEYLPSRDETIRALGLTLVERLGDGELWGPASYPAR